MGDPIDLFETFIGKGDKGDAQRKSEIIIHTDSNFRNKEDGIQDTSVA